MPSMPPLAPMPPIPIEDLPPFIWLIMAMPSFMAFMWSAIRAWRSSGVLAAIILSCISCIDFIIESICAGDGVLAAVAGLCAAFAADFAGALTGPAGAEAPAG